MRKFNIVFNLVLLLLVFSMSSCLSSRKAYRTGPILVKSNIYIVDAQKSDNLHPSDFTNYITPIPNNKFLGVVRYQLFAYEIGTLCKNGSLIQKWLQDIIGEPPVYADSVKYDKSVKQLQQQLFNFGYFNPEISYTETINRRGNAKVNYYIKPKQPYIYNEINNETNDTVIQNIIFPDEKSSLISKGDILNSYTLDKERTRISSLLRDNGYFLFSKDLIEYNIDTNLYNHKANISLKLNKPVVQINGQNTTILSHKYYIRNVNIYSNFDPNIDYSNPEDYDIHITKIANKEKLPTDGKFCIYDVGKRKLKHDVIINSTLIRPGHEYKYMDVTLSSKSLTNITVVRYANIIFTPVTSLDDSLLDCTIKLTRKKQYSPSINTEVTNTGGRLGFGLNFNMSDRNIFKGGESLSLTAAGSVELQFGKNNTDAGNLIYTAQTGVTASLYFPRILGPFGLNRLPGYFSPKTNIDVGYSYQHRTELYERIISNVTFGYSWKQRRYLSNSLIPIDFNYVHINKEKKFEDYIAQMKGSLYKSQYTSHTFLGIRYSFVFSDLIDKVAKGDYFYFRATVESSGNILNFCSKQLHEEKDSLGIYNFLGVPYSQYVMSDFEFKYYHYFATNRLVIFRLITGLGLPYSNSFALPVERAFYGGGANDMRGWGLKLLGPGSYSSDVDIERVADISLKANLEYRVPIYKYLRFALFADAGNIWLRNKDADFEGGEFNINRFYKEIAVDCGLGLRLDFDFFVLRLDVGLPIVDPSQPEGDRVIPFSFRNAIWNIAIGYPF